jgi:hypothetical protein
MNQAKFHTTDADDMPMKAKAEAQLERHANTPADD